MTKENDGGLINMPDLSVLTGVPPGEGIIEGLPAVSPEVFTGLVERIEIIAQRLDTLIETIVPLIEGMAVEHDPPIHDRVNEVNDAAMEALTYTAFFQEAVRLGMSPAMIPDAYRLADLTHVTVDLETGEVTGIKETVEGLLENKPYLFAVRPSNVGSETNPAKGESSYPEQVENLARALGVSPGFAAELVRKRSNKAGNGVGIPEMWRVPRINRLSYLETNE